jgi:hypothetical protein
LLYQRISHASRDFNSPLLTSTTLSGRVFSVLYDIDFDPPKFIRRVRVPKKRDGKVLILKETRGFLNGWISK